MYPIVSFWVSYEDALLRFGFELIRLKLFHISIWYVSNVSIIFYCSMLLYILFWMFNGLYYTLLYYFWDLPTNPRPSANCCFLPISVFRIKRITNRMKPSGELFLEQYQHRRLGVHARKRGRRPRGRGHHVCPIPWFSCLPWRYHSKNISPEGFIPFGLRLIFLFYETQIGKK